MIIPALEIRPIRRAYKYVGRDVADQVAKGSVRIGTFDYYRAAEGERGDPFEGITENRIDHYKVAGEIPEAGRAALAVIGVGGT